MKQVILLLASVGFSWQVYAQFSLKGTVTDNNHEALIGAHVQLKGTFFQTITDNTGNFTFSSIRKGDYRLVVSYIGYENWEQDVDLTANVSLEISMKESAVVSDAVIVSAVRATQNTPTTFTTLNKEDIARENLAQDIPYMLTSQPSVVVTSDAGAGVGYTGLRIRGSDITRINVTINGIPLNDPESHAVYWVDIPDFASSVNSLQVQRGVGSSTNGAGAFGASMNLETSAVQTKPYGLINASAGSFGTYKTTFLTGTGLIRDHWYFEGRASDIGSDGYIDRASSRLSSFFLQCGYASNKTLVKIITFGGNEKTYQAWYGTDAATMKTDRTFNWAGAVFNPDGSIWFYNNQTDNYKQNHYQIHISHQFNPLFSFNVAGHYTYGRGYYEEYMQDQALTDYGLQNIYLERDSLQVVDTYHYFYHDSITHTDLIRRRWLDNKYYGATWSFRGHFSKANLILGGAWNKYDHARHYGQIIWAQYASNSKPFKPYYDNTGFKTDFNIFLKAGWSPVKNVTIYGDMQYRYINYKAAGLENDLLPIRIGEQFYFFNPKVGVSINNKLGTLYASYSIAHREPNRDDYVDAEPGEKPEPEILGDLETGIRRNEGSFIYSVDYFLMNYHNQLVLTGEINQDGAYVRKNTGKSYRTGVEITGGYHVNSYLFFSGDLSLMTSKTDYRSLSAEGELITYHNVDISFSPRVVGGLGIEVTPLKNLDCVWQMKYVGRQYLDNTENKVLSLNAYSYHNLRFNYLVPAVKFAQIELNLAVNNVFNRLYESNGYVYGDTPYYYPQAGINFLAGLSARF